MRRRAAVDALRSPLPSAEPGPAGGLERGLNQRLHLPLGQPPSLRLRLRVLPVVVRLRLREWLSGAQSVHFFRIEKPRDGTNDDLGGTGPRVREPTSARRDGIGWPHSLERHESRWRTTTTTLGGGSLTKTTPTPRSALAFHSGTSNCTDSRDSRGAPRPPRRSQRCRPIQAGPTRRRARAWRRNA